MKAKLATMTLLGLVACSLALPQNTTAGEAPAGAATTPVVTQPGAVIPLIQFQDVPLTTAIENLARQASLNYILDPKVGFGQPDEKGVLKVQPNISIRWENLTAEQALTALLQNYGLQLIEDPKTRIARITVKDPAIPDPLVTRIVQLKFASPSNVLASVIGTLTDKRSKVIADVRTSQLVVLATEKELTSMEDLVARLDTQTKQVLIEAKLLETSMNPRTVKGIDWSGTLEAQKFTLGNNALPGTSPTPYTPPTPASQDAFGNVVPATPAVPATAGTIGGILSDPKLLMNASQGSFFNPATAFLNADGVSAVLSFLNTSADSRVLATPRAVTVDNETADLSVTRAFPIFKNTAGTQGSPGGSEVTYTNLGTILKVTPRISANNFVNLRVVPEVSSIFTTITKTVAGTISQADVYDIRKIDTQVMIPSGNTLVLGGLMQDKSTKGHTKVPILGDLPLIGLLFRKDSKARDQSNLLIFITPTIVQDSDFQPATTDFLKSSSKVPEEPEWTAWDDGKPLDWSKPKPDASYTGHRDPTE